MRRWRDDLDVRASRMVNPPSSARPATTGGLACLVAEANRCRGFLGCSEATIGSEGHRKDYPNKLQPWKPPLLFQFCEVR